MNNKRLRRAGARSAASSTASKEQADRQQRKRSKAHDLGFSPVCIHDNASGSGPRGGALNPLDIQPSTSQIPNGHSAIHTASPARDLHLNTPNGNVGGAQAFRIDGQFLDGTGASFSEQAMFQCSSSGQPQYPMELDFYQSQGTFEATRSFDFDDTTFANSSTAPQALSETMQTYLNDYNVGSEFIAFGGAPANAS